MESSTVDAAPALKETWPTQIEKKYYAVRLLTHWVGDGNLDRAREHLRALLDLSAPTLAQRRTLAWELNVLLCNRAHEYKVAPWIVRNCAGTWRGGSTSAAVRTGSKRCSTILSSAIAG